MLCPAVPWLKYFKRCFWGHYYRASETKKRGMMTRPNQKDLVFLKELLEAGKVVPVIERCYPLGEVAEAIKYLVEGHARGKVVITVERDHKT
jgi:NADPH:quinone reductase-like Zn-dependent oxidoreductase